MFANIPVANVPVNGIAVFVAEVSVCILVSLLILVRLQRMLRHVSAEVCERGGAATEFWIAYTQLMMVVAPVLLVAFFSRAGLQYSVLEQMKSSLSLILWGQFLGLALVGRAVWNSINRAAPATPARLASPPGAPAVASA